MAITASTVAKNRIVISVAPRSVFESAKALLSSAVTINQGDLVALDTSSHILKVVSATTDAPNFLGIMPVSVKSGKIVGPYDGLTAVDSAQALADCPGPVHDVVCALKLKVSDAFNPGDKVYLANGQDSMTVSVTDPGTADPIGIFQGAAVASAAAGQEGLVLISARYKV